MPNRFCNAVWATAASFRLSGQYRETFPPNADLWYVWRLLCGDATKSPPTGASCRAYFHCIRRKRSKTQCERSSSTVKLLGAGSCCSACATGGQFCGRRLRDGAIYHVFDLLWLDGREVSLLPFDERHTLLQSLPLEKPLQRVARLSDAKPWERACREGWEGVIAKRRDSRYEHRRSPH
jgi:hypothetical protein